MDKRDLRLGIGRAISRRDFLNGVGVAIGASRRTQPGISKLNFQTLAEGKVGSLLGAGFHRVSGVGRPFLQ